MIVKALQETDIDQAARLLNYSWQVHFRKYLSPDLVDQFTYERCTKIWKNIFEDKGSPLTHLGIFDSGDLLGTISAGASRTRDETWFEIWSMHVLPNRQRSGIGTLLLSEAFRLSDERNYRNNHLTCIKQNQQALDFYTKNGGKIGADFDKRGFQEVEVYWNKSDF